MIGRERERFSATIQRFRSWTLDTPAEPAPPIRLMSSQTAPVLSSKYLDYNLPHQIQSTTTTPHSINLVSSHVRTSNSTFQSLHLLAKRICPRRTQSRSIIEDHPLSARILRGRHHSYSMQLQLLFRCLESCGYVLNTYMSVCIGNESNLGQYGCTGLMSWRLCLVLRYPGCYCWRFRVVIVSI